MPGKKDRTGPKLRAMLRGLRAARRERGKQMMADGRTYTFGRLLAMLEEDEKVWKEIEALDAKLREAYAKRERAIPRVRRFLAGLERGLRTHFGGSSPRLESFGVKPEKERRKLTRKEQALANARRAATRARRQSG